MSPSLRSVTRGAGSTEPLAVLVLPTRLEEFDLVDHARDLLEIPRVIAIEPPRWRARRLLGEVVALRQARRLRFPGRPRAFVLYDPRQYHLARALSVKHEAELWYLRGTSLEPTAQGRDAEDLVILDELAGDVANRTLAISSGADVQAQNESLRARLVELEIISSRPFVPGARVERRSR